MIMYSLLLFFILVGSAISCKCIVPPAVAEDFARTPIIFIGRVINKASPPGSFGSIEYTMEVEEAFKGTTVGAQVTVNAREQGPACGIGIISVGDRRQVWLSENGSTSSCTRTTSDIYRDHEELQQLANNSS